MLGPNKNKGAAAGGKKSGPRGTYVEPRDSTPTLAELEVRDRILRQAQKAALDAWYAEADLGDLTRQIPTQKGKRTDKQLTGNSAGKSKKEILAEHDLEETQVRRFEALSGHRDVIALAGEKAEEKKDWRSGIRSCAKPKRPPWTPGTPRPTWGT